MASLLLLLCAVFAVGSTGAQRDTGEAASAGGGVAAAGAASAGGGALRAWASRRRPLTLGCPSASPAAPAVGWLLRDRPLALRADGRRTMLPDGALHIAKVQPKADVGEYRCMVRTADGLVASPAIAVQLAGISHDFSTAPQNATAAVGEVVRLTCQIQSVPSATIAWEHDKKQLPHNSRYVTVEPGVLYITSVQTSDEGNYRCVATNPVTGKKRPSAEGRLTVSPADPGAAPAQLLPPPAGPVNASEGGAATLVCAASGVPPPPLRWTLPDGTAGTAGAGLVTLPLSNVTAADAGDYTCSTEDGEQQQKVTLSVWQPPEVRVKPPSQSFPAAKTVRFNCEAVGEPKPELVWFKDGVRLHINGRMKQRGTELLIATTQMSDSGLYQCAARNAAGESYAVARLSIKSPSRIDPPRGLSCRTLPSGGIELSWNQPAGGNFTAFTVHYLPTEGGEETQAVTVNQSIRVEDLQPFTNYTLYTRVYFQRSASEESERVVCRTAEGVPTTAPRVSVETVDETTASVSWQPLTPAEARGYVASYKLQWGPQGEAAYSVEELPPSTTHYTLTGLEPGRNYNVRVLAATSRGYPTEDLPWVTVQMPGGGGGSDGEEGPGGGAVALVVTRVNATVLQVTWKKPNTSLDDGVQLWYRPRGSSEVGPFTYDANATHAVLTGLVEGPLYEIRVRSGGVAGFAVSVPSLPPPLDVSATPTSPRSLRITWTASPDVARYSVAVTPLGLPGGAEGKQRHFFVSTPPAIEVNDLQPNTLYEVKIRSEDSTGRKGPYGQTMEVRTPEDVPGHVRDVRPEALNGTSIRVTWRPPAVLNGVLAGYTVAVDTDRAAALPGRAARTASVSAVKHSADVSGLQPNVQYFVTVSARNGAGHGPPSGTKGVVIRVAEVTTNKTGVAPPVPPVVPPPPRGDRPPAAYDDRHLGIAIGVSVGVVCVVVCVAAFLWHRRCPRVRAGRRRRGRGPGAAGGGGGTDGGSRYASARPQWELDVLGAPPPLAESHIPPPPPPELFDTKGGYPNGHTNGVKRPVLSNGRIPNGHASTGIHITENPQYKCGDKGGASPESEGLPAVAGAGAGEREQLLVQHGSAASDSAAADTSAEGSVVDTTQLTLLGSDLASTTSE